jgi:hypothetical protein
LADPEVLRIAAESGRVLFSQDRGTMPAHFTRYLLGAQSAGLVLLREATPILTAMEELILIWSASGAEERMAWIPL